MKFGKYHIVRKDKYNIIVGVYKRRTSDCPKGTYKEGDKYLFTEGNYDDLRSAIFFVFNKYILKDINTDVVEDIIKKIDKFKKELWERIPEIKCSNDFTFEPREWTEDQKEAARKRMVNMHKKKGRKRQRREE